nr:glycerate kinase [Pseudomonas aeruginosa]EKU5857214.1 glycerate kinase [Pseudomonas aeruginosa]
MKVVIAPDSFKESLSAELVAEAIALGVRDSAPDAEIVCVPMADGGEGTVDAVLAATRGERRFSRVRGPLGAEVQAAWGWLSADSTPFGHSAHADPDTCSTIIRTGSRSAATQGWHC